MDRWRKTYEGLGFDKLDRMTIRFLLYGVTAAFWIQVAVWLLLRKELIPGVEGVWGWLVLSLLAVPGNIRTVFFIALGPNPRAVRKAVLENPAVVEPPRRRRRIRFRLRREWRRAEQPSREEPLPHAQPYQDTWASTSPNIQHAPPAPSTDVPATQPPTAVRKGSVAGILVKVLAGVAIFAVCGGYWLTGGTIVDPSDKTTEPPRLKNQAEKRHMLDIINEARRVAGVPPVTMGTNNVAQIQAENLLRDCILSHWGTDGLKPYMRYSLAGGYQNNGENILTSNECNLTGTFLQWNEKPMEMVKLAVEDLLESPGHRRTMLDPSYSKVNIGLSWDRNTFKAVQHFEGDFVEFSKLPVIEEGKLELEGILKNGHRFTHDVPLIILIMYDPAPVTLTRAQLARTSCYGTGEIIAMLLPASRLWKETHQTTETLEEPRCVDPYTVSKDAQAPETIVDMSEIWEEADESSDRMRETELTLTLKRAEEIIAEDDFFSVTADVEELLEERGPGVYTVVLVANLENGYVDEEQVISEYSVFHQANPPGTYGGNR